ncbi:hypothetical protein HBA55_16220 [Pseudomaricurvus alkylphenolicus]|jgi:hypothetical protein|uniref:hypothetical protein n=1 Tax=Pseudomaricurvus alkylphenolicus TaxID=1306991 RepID=UPI00141EC606|nr:hypothetical protein [Pseudomaricurvus alkylphenolicus]NIB41150.1 hypothetical protein [Pseudomaricurvus alkylphenolicus]
MSALSSADFRPEVTELKTSIRSLAQPIEPQKNSIDVYLSQMMGIDYVFLCSQKNPEQQECVRMAAQLMNARNLSSSRCMFLIATGKGKQRKFRQCLIHWVDNHPVEVTCTEVTSPSQLEHYQTILGHGRLIK